MEGQIKAIETKYKGYRFRSRLEARWAVFFENVGAEWEYETEGFDLEGLYYLPDFKVDGGFWYEVKGSGGGLSDTDILKMILFSKHIAPIWLLDGTPDYGSYFCFEDGLLSYSYEFGEEKEEYKKTTEELIKKYKKLIASKSIATKRFGDVPYTSNDNGRPWYAECGVDVNNGDTAFGSFHDAITKARSARFEHGERG